MGIDWAGGGLACSAWSRSVGTGARNGCGEGFVDGLAVVSSRRARRACEGGDPFASAEVCREGLDEVGRMPREGSAGWREMRMERSLRKTSSASGGSNAETRGSWEVGVDDGDVV